MGPGAGSRVTGSDIAVAFTPLVSSICGHERRNHPPEGAVRSMLDWVSEIGDSHDRQSIPANSGWSFPMCFTRLNRRLPVRERHRRRHLMREASTTEYSDCTSFEVNGQMGLGDGRPHISEITSSLSGYCLFLGIAIKLGMKIPMETCKMDDCLESRKRTRVSAPTFGNFGPNSYITLMED